jgi:DNA-binding response OmpR family regulator
VSDLGGKTILVIDDDRNLLRLVEHTFSPTGALLYTAESGEEGLRRFYARQPDLVILDVMMPDMDGWQVCSRIREVSDVPIVFLTALGKELEVVRGLDCGAVDYVTKPFSPDILVARVRAALRRTDLASGQPKLPSYRDDYLTIDLEARRVLVRGKLVKLTATEYQLLAYLVQNSGRVLGFQQILEKVWGCEYQDSINYVHVYMSHLRNKLEEDPKNPCYLLTEHGVGYRFQRLPSAETGGRQGASSVSANPD